jgi:hypothetical protein
MDYTIISSRCKDKLIGHIKDYIEDGWVPQGGHCHVVYEEEVQVEESFSVTGFVTELRTTGCWSQSMVKGE